MTNLISNIIKNCELCVIHKLNKFLKPEDEQIISYKPMERMQADITYFNKNYEFYEIRNKYLLNFKDHFSKYCKSFVIDNKKAETVLEKLKIIIKEWGTPNIFHTDNGGEFTANIIKLFCIDNNIKQIFGGPRHPRSQGAMEAFNKYIIQKLRIFKLEEKNNFDIDVALDKVIKIYNNSIHSVIKIEPAKAFFFKEKKKLNKVLKNIIKSQINMNKNSIIIEKGTKALLCNAFVIKDKLLNEKKKN